MKISCGYKFKIALFVAKLMFPTGFTRIKIFELDFVYAEVQ